MSTPSTAGSAVADHVRTAIGDVAALDPPAGYDSTALALIDAIWSIGVRYASVVNVLNAYRHWVRDRGGQPDRRTIKELVDDLHALGGAEGLADITNRQRTSTRSGILKAEAVTMAAKRVAGFGIDGPTDLLQVDLGPVKEQWTQIPGQGSGLSWRYFLMNNRIHDVKPDRMIIRFVTDALDLRTPVTSVQAAELLREAHGILTEDHPGLTLRALDHAAWRHQRTQRR